MLDDMVVALTPHSVSDAMLLDPSFSSLRTTNASALPANAKPPPEAQTDLLTHPQDALDAQSMGAPCDTPSTIPDTDITSPKTHLRRNGGRRPLSILSNSSLNSNPELYPALESRSPESWSPGRHRRHRSVIGSSVDYRAYHGLIAPSSSPAMFPSAPLGSAGLTGRVSPGLSGTATFNHFEYPPSHHHPAYPPHWQSYPRHPEAPCCQAPLQPGAAGCSHSSPNLGHHATSPTMGSAPLGSPFDSVSPNGLDEMFVILAYKERRVIEATQNLAQAKEDLALFRKQIGEILQPEMVAVPAPLRPSIISRRLRVGLNTLQFVPVYSTDGKNQPPSIEQWQVDIDVDNAVDDYVAYRATTRSVTRTKSRSSATTTITLAKRDGIALSVIKCLLGVVQFIIATLPSQQQTITYEQPPPRRIIVSWRAQYPMPMDTMYSHFWYEA